MRHTNKQKLEMALLFMMLAIVISSVLFKFVFQTLKSEDDSSTLVVSYADGTGSKTSNRRNTAETDNKQDKTIQTKQSPRAEAIHFDPNTADAETLLKVGFTPWQVKNIMNYRAKGGAYHRIEDVKRIYGLTYGQWNHIKDLISIGKDYQYIADNEDLSYKQDYNRNTGNTSSGTSPDQSYTPSPDQSPAPISNQPPSPSQNNDSIHATATRQYTRVSKLRLGEKIDINLNDTLQMQRIPGIASKRARILFYYINKLGGLASADQLNDEALSNMPLDLADYIIIDTTKIRKLKINKLYASQLAYHPYINWSQARQITQHIHQHGPIKDWNELLSLSEMYEEDKLRLEPYISFE